MDIIPLLSIIIPTFNSEKHIQECLDSVKNQEWDNYEVLIIDGKSIDGTIEIIERNRLNFSSLLVISEKDEGVYDAMNKGINAARGKWLYFLGSDDKFIDENVLGFVFDVLGNSDPDILYGNVQLAKTGQIYAGEFGNQKMYEMNISQQAIFYKRRIFEIVGSFDPAYKSNADWAHNFHWFFNSKIRKMYVDRVVALYSENGLSSWFVDQAFKRHKEKLYLKLAGKNIKEEYKTQVLKFLVINRRDSRNYPEFLWYAFIFFIRTRSFSGLSEIMGRRRSQ